MIAPCAILGRRQRAHLDAVHIRVLLVRARGDGECGYSSLALVLHACSLHILVQPRTELLVERSVPRLALF